MRYEVFLAALNHIRTTMRAEALDDGNVEQVWNEISNLIDDNEEELSEKLVTEDED